jgi:hypothetical protein
MLLTHADDLIDPFFYPATANWFACPLAAAIIDDLLSMLLRYVIKAANASGFLACTSRRRYVRAASGRPCHR